MSNTLKTTLLLGLLTGIILGLGQMFGGSGGLVIAFVFAVVMNFGSYWFSDRIVLAMYRARPVDMNQAPKLHAIVNNLAAKAQIPVPRIYLIEAAAPNAFATGRNPANAAVAVTRGILRLMDDAELEGVLAHELSHIRNRDILISSVAATLAGVIMMLAGMARWAAIFGGFQRDSRDDGGGGIFGLLAMAILAPLAAAMIQMAISRSREFQADASAAGITHNPLGLAAALAKLGSAIQRVALNANPQTAHLFIVNPLRGQSFARLFSTHPPLEQRIARLRSMIV